VGEIEAIDNRPGFHKRGILSKPMTECVAIVGDVSLRDQAGEAGRDRGDAAVTCGRLGQDVVGICASFWSADSI